MSFPSPSEEGGLAGAGVVGGFWAKALGIRSKPIPRISKAELSAPLFRIAMSCLALPEEDRAEVGSVNLRVAHCARLVLGRLVVSRANRLTCSSVRIRRMAAQT